jgi:hypothetical protein
MSAKKSREAEPEKEEKPETLKALMKDLKEKMEELKNARRPEINNPVIPHDDIEMINLFLYNAFRIVEEYAANLRPLDRKRLNSIGSRSMGFVEDAFDLANENPQFLPQFLTLDRFERDYDYFKAARALLEMTDQIRELLWNITIQAADVVYTDALEFYDAARSAGKRRVDGAETVYRKLQTFFKRPKRTGAEPSKKQLERDVKALINSKRDGKVIVENVSPKIIAGKHIIVDEKFAGGAAVRETEDAEFKE